MMELLANHEGRRRLREPGPPLDTVAPADRGLGLIGSPALRLALLSGGDERLAIDPRTGRNRYGIRAEGAAGEVLFGSSTASPISARGEAAAERALARLLRGEAAAGPDWTRSIRDRLAAMFGIAGTEVVLTGSGTEAELVVLALARSLLRRPITSIVLAPGETGSGVALAAAGRHFLGSASCAPAVERGATIEGMGRDVVVEGVEIRDTAGIPHDAAVVDEAARERAGLALAGGRAVIVHCLDTSKTGLGGFRRPAAAALLADAPDRCLVVVDACQLRCSAETIRRDLAAGFVVMITGSKFAGGPPFAGAVLLPPPIVRRFGPIALPTGLSAYSALQDWPDALRARLVGAPLATALNIGLGLRWEAALAELDRYRAIPADRRRAVATAFAARVREAVAAAPGLAMLEPAAPDGRVPTIFPVLTTGRDGSMLCAKTLHQGLMSAAPGSAPPDGSGRVFHVGQPVAVGPAAALRICLAAPAIADVADRMAGGRDIEQALAPLTDDLVALLAKWTALREAMDRPTPARRSA